MSDQNLQKTNLLAQFAKNKLESQKSGKSSGIFGNGTNTRFPRPQNDRPSAKRGGRNGQGKPC